MTYDNIVKRQATIILVSVIVMVVIILGTSYALFMKVDESTNTQVVESGSLSIQFLSKSQTITTQSTPLEDDEGLNTEGYSFSVTNNGTLDYKYNIYVTNVADTPVSYGYLMYSIDGSTPALLSTLTSQTDGLLMKENGFVAAKGKTGDVTTHNIKIWIASSAPTSIVGQKISLKVIVSGEAVEDDSSTQSSDVTDNESKKVNTDTSIDGSSDTSSTDSTEETN